MRSLFETFVIINISILVVKCNRQFVHSFSLKNDHNNIVNNYNNFDIQPIIKVKPDEFDADIHYYHHQRKSRISENESQIDEDQSMYDYETPVLIEGALSLEKCDAICTSLVDCVGETMVDMQRKMRFENEKIEMDLYQVTFQEALDYMMESHHDDSFFCFCEGLIENNDNNNSHSNKQQKIRMKELQEFITSSQEKFFSDDDNLLNYFPMESRPSNCVILAGEGASSTLHRDPFEWTGTSLCLEGTKLWRFIAPPNIHQSNTNTVMMDSGVQVIDEHLNSYRLSSIAWDGGDEENESPPITISSGWQSDYSLYYYRDDDELPSALELASLEDDEERLAMLEHIAHSTSLLCPNLDPIPTSSIWTVIQKPGDLLLIPAHWWHQTYALEPSLAIASQRSGFKKNTRDAIRTLKHILLCSNCATPTNVHQHPIIQNFLKSKESPNPQKLIEELFHTISIKNKEKNS